MLYSTTDDFMQLFGLASLNDLPSLRELEQMIPSSQSNNPDDEDPRVKQMRKLVQDMKADVSVTLKYDPKEDEKFLQDIREKVKSIPTSTPTLEAQDQEKELAKTELKKFNSQAENSAPETLL
jgi:ABC-type Zn uptake system ZnuABC Zn-binding protein ZnuA